MGVVYTADMTTPLTESGVAAGSPLEREREREREGEEVFRIRERERERER